MEQAILTLVAATAGFMAKSLWDLYWQRRERHESMAAEKRIQLYERQLSEFYWPLYLHLQKNNVIWEHLIEGPRHSGRSRGNEGLAKEMDQKLLESFFLPNHEAMVELIESNAYLAQPDSEFERLILRFIRHVTIFKVMRAARMRADPIAVGEPWPADFFPAVERRLRSLQSRYDAEIGAAQGEAGKRTMAALPEDDST